VSHAEESRNQESFAGRWRIMSMSAWEDDFLDEEVEAYIEFKDRAGVTFALATSKVSWIAAQPREMASQPSVPSVARRRRSAGPGTPGSSKCVWKP